jgi:hypothetical protein
MSNISGITGAIRLDTFHKNIFLQTLTLIFACMIWLTGCSQAHTRDTKYNYSKPNQLTDGIKIDNIANLNIDSSEITELTQLILKDSFPNIHSLLIAKDAKLIYENYFSGKDESWGWS